jgi:hypothetical protein
MKCQSFSALGTLFSPFTLRSDALEAVLRNGSECEEGLGKRECIQLCQARSHLRVGRSMTFPESVKKKRKPWVNRGTMCGARRKRVVMRRRHETSKSHDCELWRADDFSFAYLRNSSEQIAQGGQNTTEAFRRWGTSVSKEADANLRLI